MTLAFYLDDDVERRALAYKLTKAGIDVLRATDAGNHAIADSSHLEFASSVGRTLVTGDSDFQGIHWKWMAEERPHAGVVIVAPELSVGERVHGLTALSAYYVPVEMHSQMVFLKQWVGR